MRPVSLKAAVKVIITKLVLAVTACTPLKIPATGQENTDVSFVQSRT